MKRHSIAKQTLVETKSDKNSPVTNVAPKDDGCEEESPPLSLKERIRRKKMEIERCVLIQALRKTGGNKAEAARLLRINYSTLHLKIKLYGISGDEK
jgi:DNA-binding NtrC family response regulator